jgi:hypothetical protein
MNTADMTMPVAQAARLLKLSPQRVRTLLRKGRLQGYQTITLGGRMTWRVHLGLQRRHGKPGRPSTKRSKRVTSAC